jgi:hypothetical protein
MALQLLREQYSTVKCWTDVPHSHPPPLHTPSQCKHVCRIRTTSVGVLGSW